MPIPGAGQGAGSAGTVRTAPSRVLPSRLAQGATPPGTLDRGKDWLMRAAKAMVVALATLVASACALVESPADEHSGLDRNRPARSRTVRRRPPLRPSRTRHRWTRRRTRSPSTPRTRRSSREARLRRRARRHPADHHDARPAARTGTARPRVCVADGAHRAVRRRRDAGRAAVRPRPPRGGRHRHPRLGGWR